MLYRKIIFYAILIYLSLAPYQTYAMNNTAMTCASNPLEWADILEWSPIQCNIIDQCNSPQDASSFIRICKALYESTKTNKLQGEGVSALLYKYPELCRSSLTTELQLGKAICHISNTHDQEAFLTILHNATQHHDAIMQSFGYENTDNSDDFTKACQGIRHEQNKINPRDIFTFIRGNNNIGVYILLANRISPNIQNNYGDTPLHLAAEYNNQDALKILIEKGADVNAKNEDGDTPLHLAAWYNNTELIQILLNQKADATLTDNDGNTPLILELIRKFQPF